VIVRPDRILFTALQLMKGVEAVQVRLNNGDIYDHVELIGTDERRDVPQEGFTRPVLAWPQVVP
jgi:hypothetical protein